jgi:uncharacterized protein
VPEYLSPDVYVEEIDAGAQPIEGVSTSTAGFIGVARRGPTTGLPLLITSFNEFRREFGGYFDFGGGFTGQNFLPHAVNGFFVNGGKRVYIRRVIGGGTAVSSLTARGGVLTRLLADAPVGTSVRLATLREIQSGPPATQLTFTQVKDGITTTSGPHAVSAYNPATNVVTLGTPLASAFEARFTTVATNITRLNTFLVSASDPGTWGDTLDVQVFPITPARAQVLSIIGPAPSSQVQLSTAAGFYVGAQVEFDRGHHKVSGRVNAINGKVITVSNVFAALTDLNAETANPTVAYVWEFGLTATFGDVTESFRNLTLENIPGHFYQEQINTRSDLITVGPPLSGVNLREFPSGDDGLHILLAGGNDGTAPAPLDFVGVDGGPGNRTGIQALMDVPEISIVAVPGITDQAVQQALIDHSELMRYRVAVLDPSPTALSPATYVNDIKLQREQFESKYAALYCPRITLLDPLSGLEIDAPPSGHMAGIYARVDEERGVHKAPANEVIRGITDLELILNKGEQDILNPEPNNINVLRDFRAQGRALRVWGARCITTDTAFKYLNVRRLFNFIEASLDQGTQYAVFEPNDERLWARISQSITNFLIRVWHDGALFGTKQEEAFFVKCDRTTMTQDDIDNGRLIILVGIAPVKPAEFVIIRIGQKSGLTTVEEFI